MIIIHAYSLLVVAVADARSSVISEQAKFYNYFMLCL